ncbi:MAG TPA: tRNA (adenosine(37)-N6)-threonylcarbamoyltransferase complex dimerization subunit type 1 TsaB [Ohtaekwangia sp.]|nr:tRNA (adenosine(37)-N6)-threonylcarbamoyltransferase complex dimerization subunit type 1 TsaB [Ohtaekwangia sp.]
MSLILSLETSTSVCSVALHDGGRVLACLELHQDQSHASKLAVLIKQVMETAGKDFKMLSAVAVSSGPGSYTGLRIGTSTAKGLCYTLSIPLLACNTLEIMASEVNNMNVTKALCCPMIDARRMEVYCYILDAKNNVVQPLEARVIDESSFLALLETNQVLFFGNGSAKCKEMIQHENAVFISGIYPSAAQLGILAHSKFREGMYEDLVTFEPLYLKEFLIKQSLKVKANEQTGSNFVLSINDG